MEDKLRFRTARGARIEALLNHGDFQAAVESVRATWIQEWRAAKRPVKRERIWHLDHALDALLLELRRWANDGKIAHRELEDIIAKQK